MPEKLIQNLRSSSSGLPRYVDLRIHYPSQKYLEVHSDADCFTLEYKDSQDEKATWTVLAKSPSLSGAQSEADKFVGRVIDTKLWEDTV